MAFAESGAHANEQPVDHQVDDDHRQEGDREPLAGCFCGLHFAFVGGEGEQHSSDADAKADQNGFE